MIHGTRESFKVRSYDLDRHGRLAVPALCSYLEETASLNARALGFGLEQLRERDLTWFLWRLHLRAERLPGWGERVVVETWPAEMDKFYAVRDYRWRGDDGEELGVATSAWLLVDTASRRVLRRMPEGLRALHPDPPQRALDVRFRRLPGASDGERGSEHEYTVGRADIDLNGHLNHRATIAVLLETVPAEVEDGCRLAELELELKAEGHLGDRLAARCARGDDDTFLHSLERPTDGAVLARARSRWRPA